MIYVFQGLAGGGYDIHRLLVVAESEEEAREKAAAYCTEQRRLEAERSAWYDRAWAGLKPRERGYGPDIIARHGEVPPGNTGPTGISDLLETHDDIFVVEDCYE